MQRTVEQQSADDQLQAAIDNYLAVYERDMGKNNPILVSYVIITEHINMGDDATYDTEVNNIITKHNERLSVAKGLLQIGVDIVCSDDED